MSLSIVSTYTYVGMHAIGLGPATWVYSSEIFPLKLRAQGASIGVAVNRGMNAAVSMSFISIYKEITIGVTFLMFAGICMLAWGFIYLFLPETKGRSWKRWRCSSTRRLGQEIHDGKACIEEQVTQKSSFFYVKG